MARQRATIEEIAAKAGVSIATVSNVLNRKGRFSEQARVRVLSAAEELCFTPNALIRSLRTGRTNLIGVRTWPYFAGLTDHSISMYLQQGFTSGLMQAGYDELSYIDFPNRPERDRALQFLDGRIDGLILGPSILTNDQLQILADSGLPVVMVYKQNAPASMGAVSIDNAGGLDAGVRHLAELGHRCIGGYFAGMAADMEERREAFLSALTRYGCVCEPSPRYDSEDYLAPVAAAMDWFLALPQTPTALLFGDDNAAMQGIDVLNARGLRVPHDISVVGFDDAPVARHGSGLTTVQQPAHEVGQRAVEMVVRLIKGASGDTCRVHLPVTLHVRGSTGPPKRLL